MGLVILSGTVSALPAAMADDTPSGYELLDWEPVGNCYWNSADHVLYNVLITSENKPLATNLGMFVSSGRMFTREDIPVGSYIEIGDGYQYRPEAWGEELGKTESRPGNVSEPKVYVDEEWWGDSMYKAFNVSAKDSSQIGNKVDEIRDVLKIYVPSDTAEDPSETAAATEGPSETEPAG